MSEHDAGLELDRHIAEQVMGWCVMTKAHPEAPTIGYWPAKEHRFDLQPRFVRDWQPSKNIAQAWEVVDRMIALGWILCLTGEHDSPREAGPIPWCVQWASPALGDARRSYADTAQLAICRAALKACS